MPAGSTTEKGCCKKSISKSLSHLVVTQLHVPVPKKKDPKPSLVNLSKCNDIFQGAINEVFLNMPLIDKNEVKRALSSFVKSKNVCFDFNLFCVHAWLVVVISQVMIDTFFFVPHIEYLMITTSIQDDKKNKRYICIKVINRLYLFIYQKYNVSVLIYIGVCI